MILGDIVDAPDGLHMFYVGFQRVAKAKFLAFTGLAVSRDGGDTFSARAGNAHPRSRAWSQHHRRGAFGHA